MPLRQIFKHYWRDESGASAVEFIMMAPIFIVLLVGTVDFGFFMTEKMRLQTVAQVTADYVSQTQVDDNAQVVAAESYDGDFEDVTLTSNFTCECSDGTAQECPVSCGDDDYQRRFVDVSASAVFEPIFPYPGLPDNVTLQSTVRMRVD